MKRVATIILLCSVFLASCGGSSSTDTGSGEVGLSRTQSLALGLDPDIQDTDGDGISDADEVGSDPNNPLDSDNDGVIDALEAGSAAADSTQAVITLNVSPQTATSLALKDLSGLALKIGVTGGTIDPVGLLKSESSLTGDADYDFPYGLFHLKVSLSEGANSSTVTLEYPQSLTIPDGMVLRVRNKDGVWVSFTSAVQTKGVIQIPFFNSDGLQAKDASLQITDGGEFDLDPAVGKIYYETGLGKKVEAVPEASVGSTVPGPDGDADTVEDSRDNCPSIANTDQVNSDDDAQGNACDTDDDNDGLSDVEEVVKNTNPLKADTDNDGVDDLKDELPLDPEKVLTLKSAHRLLLQTTFGPLSDDLDKVQKVGAEKWVDEQLKMPAAHDDAGDDHLTHLERLVEIAKQAKPNQLWYEAGTDGLAIFNRRTADGATDDYQMAAWWENSIGLHPTKTKHGSDQLRQRVAFALSQILVVSSFEGNLSRRGEGLAHYYDMLVRHAFGNYRDLLGEMARNPVMGVYLSHQGNQKANLATGTIPDENFARELMQLFAIGLYELNMDGSPDRDKNQFSYPDAGEVLTPTYNEIDVQELAKIMTGWDLAHNTRYGVSAAKFGDYTVPMEFTASEHEDEIAAGGDGKVTIFGETLSLNSGTDGSGLDEALDLLFNHPNMAPHVSKHLIMRLVTSNPSSDYVARVAKVFVNNGSGVRGDLGAVVRAILLDDDIRDASKVGDNDGKVKEPVIAYTQLLRALGTVPLDGWLSNNSALTPVSGVYWFKYPERTLGQGALRSHSVFNFYTPDYVPSNSYFSATGLVSPEMKILTDQNVLGYNNQVYGMVWTFVKNKIEYKNGMTISEFAQTRKFGNDVNMLSSYDEPLALMRAAVGGDLSNIESAYVSDRPNTTAAIKVIIDFYDRILLGGEMPDTFREALTTYLMGSTGTSYTDKEEVAIIMIKDTLHMIATSNIYMVQK